MRNRKTAASAVGALLLSGGLALATTAPAWADGEVCVPSEGSATTETTDWLTEAPEGDGWEVVDERTVIDREAEYGTEYLVAFYQQTGWVLTTPEGEGWVQIAERTVIDQEYVPGEYEQTGWVTESPGDGWKQIAERWVVDVEAQPAQGTPTIVIPNPDYAPGWTETIEHPAEYKTLWKYTKHGGHGFIWLDNDTWKYVDSDGNGYNKKPGKGVTYYERTQHTKKEKVKDAWTETIEHPAQGEPTIEVDNPDYVPAVEEQGHWEYKFARHVPAIPEESHQEYKFAKHIPATWMTEVPTGDGWKVKDQREVLLVEEESHIERIYQRVVVAEPVECPPAEEPTTPEEPTEEPTVPAEPEEPTEEPSETPVKPEPRQVPDATDREVETLAFTGPEGSVRPLSMIAAGLLLGGVGIGLARRRLITEG